MQYLPPINEYGAIGADLPQHDGHVIEREAYHAWLRDYDVFAQAGLAEDVDPPLAHPFRAHWEIIPPEVFAGWAADLTENWDEDEAPWTLSHTGFRAYRTRLACFPRSTYIHTMMREKQTPYRLGHAGTLISGGMAYPVRSQSECMPALAETHYLCLETLEMAADFIRFLHWNICPDGAPVQILDGPAPIQFGLEMISSLKFPEISGEIQDGEWVLNAHVLAAGKIYPALFHIALETGMVSCDKGDMVQDLSAQLPQWQVTPFVKYLVEP